MFRQHEADHYLSRTTLQELLRQTQCQKERRCGAVEAKHAADSDGGVDDNGDTFDGPHTARRVGRKDHRLLVQEYLSRGLAQGGPWGWGTSVELFETIDPYTRISGVAGGGGSRQLSRRRSSDPYKFTHQHRMRYEDYYYYNYYLGYSGGYPYEQQHYSDADGARYPGEDFDTDAATSYSEYCGYFYDGGGGRNTDKHRLKPAAMAQQPRGQDEEEDGYGGEDEGQSTRPSKRHRKDADDQGATSECCSYSLVVGVAHLACDQL